jgi:hypothetical protein
MIYYINFSSKHEAQIQYSKKQLWSQSFSCSGRAPAEPHSSPGAQSYIVLAIEQGMPFFWSFAGRRLSEKGVQVLAAEARDQQTVEFPVPEPQIPMPHRT